MTSGTSSSSITKVRLISDAPCEIMRIFLSAEFAENQGRDARRVAQVLAHQTDDGFAAFIFYVGELGEIGGQRGNRLVGVNGERNADFRGRDNVDGNFVAIEGFEDRAQKSVGQQHAGSGHIHDGDSFLGGDGFENVLALRRVGSDAGAFAGGIARVQHIDRNILLDGGQDGCRVQHFCAEIGEFGGFFEADDLDAARFRTNPGIGGHHAIDIGPDFDALGVQAGAEDGGGKVGAAAADGGGDAVRLAPMKPPITGTLSGLEQRG